ASGLNGLCCRVNGAGQLGMRPVRFGGDGDVGAIARGAQGNGQADAPAGAGDKQGLSLESAHGFALGKPRKGGAFLASMASMATRGSGAAKAAAWLEASSVNRVCWSASSEALRAA